MDLKKAAKIKAFSRLMPAKEVRDKFSSILSSTSPENLDSLVNDFVLSIESAALEYSLLAGELSSIDRLTSLWSHELDECDRLNSQLLDQNLVLEHEKEQIEESLQASSEIQKLLDDIIREKPLKKENDTKNVLADIEKIREDIKKCEETNEKRQQGIEEIMEGFRKFLLMENK